MRKLIPVMLMFVLSLASCGKDGLTSRQKEEEKKVRTDIQGTWHISQMKVDGKYTSDIDTCIKLSYFKFIGNDSYSYSNRCAGGEFAGFYSIIGNKASVSAGKLKEVYTIINITGGEGEFIRENSDGLREEFIAITEDKLYNFTGKWVITEVKEDGSFTKDFDECIKKSYFSFEGKNTGTFHRLDVCDNRDDEREYFLNKNIIVVPFLSTATTYEIKQIKENDGWFVRTYSNGESLEFKAKRQNVD